jgi:hypothetical protein
MKYINPTRLAPITAEALAEREAWLKNQMAEADRVNAELMLAKQQQDAAEFQNDLVAKTLLTPTQLEAIRSWLAANPVRQETSQNTYEEIR